MPSTLHTRTARAELLAHVRGEPYMVCEIDHEDSRRLEVHPLAYEEDPEFEAFEGEIAVVIYPDGTIE